ncbi:SAFB-like transcription modulator [Bactrocera dorsalis]|uniref:SAFB-like transcription modulator n=1 Tax=Bactrocera dorsalis TaxID=27457 RepID=A0ABM3K857_BACDO|nr:SAFB-like transcription modulator [Bactrocera dorsalis]
MGINKKKIPEAQADFSEKVLYTSNTFPTKSPSSHFGEKWDSEVQTKSFGNKDETEVIEYILEDKLRVEEITFEEQGTSNDVNNKMSPLEIEENAKVEIKYLAKRDVEVDKGNVSNDGPEGEEENAGESNEESINVTIGEDEQKLLHDKAPDKKEKCTDAEGDTTGKNSAQKSTKTVAALDDTRTSKSGSSSSKCSKSDDDKSKRKDKKSGDKKDKDISEQKSSSNKFSQKDDKETSSVNISTKSSSTRKQTTPSRNLWISGLSSLTRTRDLKTIFSKYGKVIGAKVVTNTRTPGTRCYDYVTMLSSSNASRCIENLHHTELHGRIISVELTKNEISNSTNVAKTRVDKTKIDPVGKADVVTAIWELLIPWQLTLKQTDKLKTKRRQRRAEKATRRH